MARTIRQGQYAAPRFAAQSYIAAHYVIEDADGTYSADPGDYWMLDDRAPLSGALVRREHPYHNVCGNIRLIKNYATVGDLRRLARAAESLVTA